MSSAHGRIPSPNVGGQRARTPHQAPDQTSNGGLSATNITGTGGGGLKNQSLANLSQNKGSMQNS